MTTIPITPSREGMVPYPADVVERYRAAGHWERRPLADYLLDVADRTPDALALVDGDVRLTHRDLMVRADGAAMRLRELGLRPDDRILVQLPNGWELIVLIVACLRLGAIPVLALTAHRQHELDHLVERAEARAIAVPDTLAGFDHQGMARVIASRAPTVEQVLVSGEEVRTGSVDLRALLRPADDPAGARAALDAITPDPLSAALMLLSGGTTGQPKLIARTHEDYGCYVRSIVDVCLLTSDSVYLTLLPLGHSLPLGTALAALVAGGRVVLEATPAPERAFATIERERVTATALVPAVAQRWLEHRLVDTDSDLSSVELMLVGGARLPDSLAERIAPALTRNLQQGYGMGEGGACLTRVGDPSDIIWHTQGRPMCAGDELLLVGEDGEPVPDGEPGELLTRGPCTIRGYYRAPEHNAGAFTADGWLRTGDVVRIRPDGYLVVEGREKDLINRGGEKISAEEVENFAYQVDGVSQAALVAMPDPVLGERACLYVVPRPGALVRLEDVEEVITRAGAARYKVPERLVVVDELPSTNIGKIDKKALRADIAQRLDAERLTAPAAS
ncbi:(2,3-dihydroxybenzoyl)adenylate synthase [Actinomadura livida]|uniref:2,3-dihydroxybenzoate-AMP ligase n=1 Tax=Actinomadura livida TaxID=79909 RepID=A0A7W7I8J3_9ACTN|nr:MULTISPECIES: AMP-binding protein [Actinomadura]MBB4772396.1 2,3-dihydroxybenzoate-AMP ligase [Actinomadura catellatispora]